MEQEDLEQQFNALVAKVEAGEYFPDTYNEYLNQNYAYQGGSDEGDY